MNRWMQRAAFTLLICLASSASADQTQPGLELISRVDHLDSLAREPMIAVHPSGALFVSGFGSQVTGTVWTLPPPLWRSTDEGETWERIDVGRSIDGAQGNSDVDLAIGPNGAIYFAAMGYDRKTVEGVQIAMGVSSDLGESWKWQFLSRDRFDDRPWVAVSPDGTAHAIWHDDKTVSHALSRDSGKSWQEQAAIHHTGASSHLAVGNDGRIAVRIAPPTAPVKMFHASSDKIAVSLNHGKHWSLHPIPGDIEWDPSFADPTKTPRWVEPLAWTTDGVLHHLWGEGETLLLGHSDDNGRTWTKEVVVQVAGQAFYPFMTAQADRKLALSWFEHDGETLSARIAQVNLKEPPGNNRIVYSERFVPDSWTEDKSEKQQTPAGEYLPVVFLANGDLAVVSPIQDIHNDRWGFTFWRFRLK